MIKEYTETIKETKVNLNNEELETLRGAYSILYNTERLVFYADKYKMGDSIYSSEKFEKTRMLLNDILDSEGIIYAIEEIDCEF